jgi:hypothetical protein
MGSELVGKGTDGG